MATDIADLTLLSNRTELLTQNSCSFLLPTVIVRWFGSPRLRRKPWKKSSC